MATRYFQQIDTLLSTGLTGRVQRTEGLMTAVAGFPAPVGALVEIQRAAEPPIPAEVIGFRDELTLIYPLRNLAGVSRGNPVRLVRTRRTLGVGKSLLGRVVNAHGAPIDGGPGLEVTGQVPIDNRAPPAISRPRIREPLSTGVRAIDTLLTCGRGQRMGIFAGSGVGKSVLLGMLARYTAADVNVIALVGERGREVNEFLQRDLGPEGLKKSVVVVATSDEPALLRVHAAQTATAVAEYFRDQGRDVLLLMDSLTRFALAQREIGLAAGEPPTTRGYPPSVFAMLPQLVECAGRNTLGSITAFYSVLVEGDDFHEPISDAVRGLLDGHTVLSRDLAAQGHYPAIDPLLSLSRLTTDLCTPEHLEDAAWIRRLLVAYREQEDLISIGAYRPGTHPLVDTAIQMREPLLHFLRQSMHEPSPWTDSLRNLSQLAQSGREFLATRPRGTRLAAGAA